ncbi:hypothetical protein [Tahibacter harae]|uniref:DUF4386 domain-containing protein n=1 Tax=Tahibacter harae TaxID=2963937 RepID=A0ABT1QPY1_9GAMM|nr:hypothetical protein [Tahibacter harae]MCQ4164341.1 hypothetical protein [Tahibacter harae]
MRTARQKRSAARIDMAERSDNSRMTTPVTFSPTFYRFAAICSVLSAFTTLGLIFLPQWFSGGADFDSRMARVDDPVAQLRAWIYLLHPFLVAAAAVAVAVRLRWTAPGLALFGVLGFLLWAGTEAGQQALSLVAFDRWRHAWLLADEGARSALRVQIGVYDGLWDAMYFLLLIGFCIGNTCYAAVLLRRRGLSRIVGGFYLAAALLTLQIFTVELGAPGLPEPLAGWIYPAIQPLGRTLIGLWLWGRADEREVVA